MDLNANGIRAGKHIITLEKVSDSGRADCAFFRFCLRRRPALWKQLLPHAAAGLLAGLGLIREETYLRRFWHFTQYLEKPEEQLSAFAARYLKRHPLYLPEKEMTVVSAWPQPFAEALAAGCTVRANPFRLDSGEFQSCSSARELLRRETEACEAEEHAPLTENAPADCIEKTCAAASPDAESEDAGKQSDARAYGHESSEGYVAVSSDAGNGCTEMLPDAERTLSGSECEATRESGQKTQPGGCVVYDLPFHSGACGKAQMRYCVRTPSGRVKQFSDRGKARSACCRYNIVPFLLLALWAGFLTVVSLYDASITHNFTLSLFISYFKHPVIPVLNALPVLFLAYLLYSAFGSCAWSLALTSLVTLALSWSNYFKMLFRNDPVIAEDIANIALALEFGGQYHITLSKKMIAVLLLTAIAIGFLAVHVRRRVLSGRGRAALFAVLLLAGGIGLKEIYFSDSIYNRIQNYSACNRWSQTDQFISHGFIYPFLHSFTDIMDTSEPEGYSDSKAEEILAEYRDNDIPEDKRVNLIFIQLEAFADFSKLGAFSFEKDPYEYWHALEEESYSGSLLVNIFAGGTVDTERSVLCGYSSLPTFRQNTMSYAWYFREQGYLTVGAHPCNNWFYNRRNVNSYLGFSEYRFSEDTFTSLSGETTAPDSILFPYILEQYEAAVSAGTPLFSFNVSYQGHGPYSGEERRFAEVYCSGEGVSQESFCIANNYLASVADTQEQLKVLVDGLRRSDAPVVLILFGDHMPWLGDGNSAYTEYGVNLNLAEDQGLLNYYSTPYLIWANDSAKAVTGSDFTGEGPTVSPCFLMNLLFRQCGYRGDSFMQLAGEVMDVLPVIHSSGLYDDRFMPQDTAEAEKARAALDRYLTVQFYRKHHFAAK